MNRKQRTKIIRKGWTRAESVRVVRNDRKRAQIVHEFRELAHQEDLKTASTIEQIELNAWIALAYLEARKALKAVQNDYKNDYTYSEFELKVRDMGENFELVTGDEVEHVLDNLGAPSESREFGCLFVEVIDGDYGQIFGTLGSVPYHETPVYNVRERIESDLKDLANYEVTNGCWRERD